MYVLQGAIMATERNYGKYRVLGDIIYNKNKQSFFCTLSLGFFSKTINL
jgi:hypothetical protein